MDDARRYDWATLLNPFALCESLPASEMKRRIRFLLFSYHRVVDLAEHEEYLS